MEIVSVALQTVEANQNVLFTDAVVGCSNSLLHRVGSGLITLKGQSSTQCRARYRVFFSGNIGLPAGGTVEAISVALAISGEPIASSSMIFTPAAVEEFNNVASAVFIDVPRGCCLDVSVQNTSTQPIDVQNANLIVERVA